MRIFLPAHSGVYLVSHLVRVPSSLWLTLLCYCHSDRTAFGRLLLQRCYVAAKWGFPSQAEGLNWAPMVAQASLPTLILISGKY
ncbi:hypothetical protein R1flu_012366 [Riccia fluitans]|uniref:Secreted protein n=1 Tax=Riccia fluitans TaxID=41844 RepID=A0ABD1ZCV8_9MARC